MKYRSDSKKKIKLKKTDRKALLQILGGMLLVGIVLTFSLYQTKGDGISVYKGDPVVMGDNIRGDEGPALYLTAATYGVIGMDITIEDYVEAVIIASENAEDPSGVDFVTGNPYLTAYYAQYDSSANIYGGIDAEEYVEGTEDSEDDGEALSDADALDDRDTEDTDNENGDSEDTDTDSDDTDSDDTDSDDTDPDDETTDGDSEDEDSDVVSSSNGETEEQTVSTEEEDSEPEDQNDTESSVNDTRESEDIVTVEDEPVYVAYSDDQIRNIIRTKRYGGNIASMVSELANCPDDRARVWEEIFEYWDEVNQPEFTTKYNVNSGANPSLPGNLPNDHSLCFVVLGCGLNANGTIRPEMEYRCMTALRCAEMYPNSYVLCTGGHTAGSNYAASEGGVMGSWLIEHGVDASRVIVEDASYQTCENAMKSVPLLKNNYPQVDTLVLVTSDYHVPLGALTLQAECLLDGNARVVANVGCAAPRYVNFGNGELGKQLEKLAFTGRR